MHFMTHFEVSGARIYTSAVCEVGTKELWLTFRDTLVILGAAIPSEERKKAHFVDCKLDS